MDRFPLSDRALAAVSALLCLVVAGGAGGETPRRVALEARPADVFPQFLPPVVALDANGTTHVFYADMAPRITAEKLALKLGFALDGVRYLRGTRGSWSDGEVWDLGGLALENLAVGLAPGQRPCLYATVAGAPDRGYLGCWDGTRFDLEADIDTPDGEGASVGDAVLLYESDGTPHLLVYQHGLTTGGQNHRIRHWWRPGAPGTAWRAENMPVAAGHPHGADVFTRSGSGGYAKIDAAGVVHIGYVIFEDVGAGSGKSDSDLGYVTYDTRTDTWGAGEVVDASPGDRPITVLLELVEGVPHLLVRKEGDALFLYRREGGGWSSPRRVADDVPVQLRLADGFAMAGDLPVFFSVGSDGQGEVGLHQARAHHGAARAGLRRNVRRLGAAFAGTRCSAVLQDTDSRFGVSAFHVLAAEDCDGLLESPTAGLALSLFSPTLASRAETPGVAKLEFASSGDIAARAVDVAGPATPESVGLWQNVRPTSIKSEVAAASIPMPPLFAGTPKGDYAIEFSATDSAGKRGRLRAGLHVGTPMQDRDGDGWTDAVDNCPEIANGWLQEPLGADASCPTPPCVGNQTDSDRDGKGDACEP